MGLVSRSRATLFVFVAIITTIIVLTQDTIPRDRYAVSNIWRGNSGITKDVGWRGGGTKAPPYRNYNTFREEHDALGRSRSAGRIFGTTLESLTEARSHSRSTMEALRPIGSGSGLGGATPFRYRPYPAYNTQRWQASHRGAFVECDMPVGAQSDMLVFSGRADDLVEPPMGSHSVFDIDSELCFERRSRLEPYGYSEDDYGSANDTVSTEWDSVNWGQLQQTCYERNAARYIKPANEREKTGTRTALLLRAYTGMKYTEDEKQNIRALVTELSLKTGGEYQVFLLTQQKDKDFDIMNDPSAAQAVIEKHVPREFWGMTVLWTNAQMKEQYPQIPDKYQNVHRSQWFSVQKFAQDYPDFDFYWNWELDSRYTGNHYDLLEKLGSFAATQPRKCLWERNNRYYIPGVHGQYDTDFRRSVEMIYGDSCIWGAPTIENITPLGPAPPSENQTMDDYVWGVGEEADYISLAPMFDPRTTKWVDQNMMSGYVGPENTPRRATIGTQSRCSKKLLNIMHMENQRGNHVSSEMTPQTVALHHGLKAVYAPIPIWFDRDWDPRSLNKWFNTGDDGSTSNGKIVSPFSWGDEGRYSGSTWYYRAISPMRLWNNFLGWEDTGIGGPRWERLNGRPCLPPMILHPIKDVKKPKPGFKSKSDLPY
ncbi:hypothetical protein F5884DRAFT_267942 [Xylogone sp. PMI_703]|nr:hypothetical protein F5884DRAFT_267942 [Xylogone sp. PMI_703]